MRFFATCARGTEGALRRELVGIGLPGVRGDRGGVSFTGRIEHGMRACLFSRTAMRVLVEVARYPAEDAPGLYEGARRVDWSDWLTTRTTLAVEASVSSAAITHSGFAALKVKDAVVDALREKLGARPDVDPRDPDVRVLVHLARGQATLALDLAGEPLHRRGWRVAGTAAPLKETLAASMLALGGVPRDRPFVDPMCGSGTLCIEQALAARGMAPGLSRAYGFQRWPGYRGAWQSTWDRMKEEARARVLPRAPAPVQGRDHSARALEAARRNGAAAGVAADVAFEPGDARRLEPAFPQGTLCFNPPYGERLATRPLQLEGLYRGLGDMLRRHGGWTAVVLSGSPLFERAVRLAPEVRHRLWNGPIEVRLLRYRIPPAAPGRREARLSAP